MFPPPRPWKKVAGVEPDREYLAFTSRFYMKSPLHALSFLRRAGPIQHQVENAPGAIGYSLGMNLFKMEFYTLSAWQDAESLQKFAGGGRTQVRQRRIRVQNAPEKPVRSLQRSW